MSLTFNTTEINQLISTSNNSDNNNNANSNINDSNWFSSILKVILKKRFSHSDKNNTQNVKENSDNNQKSTDSADDSVTYGNSSVRTAWRVFAISSYVLSIWALKRLKKKALMEGKKNMLYDIIILFYCYYFRIMRYITIMTI